MSPTKLEGAGAPAEGFNALRAVQMVQGASRDSNGTRRFARFKWFNCDCVAVKY